MFIVLIHKIQCCRIGNILGGKASAVRDSFNARAC